MHVVRHHDPGIQGRPRWFPGIFNHFGDDLRRRGSARPRRFPCSAPAGADRHAVGTCPPVIHPGYRAEGIGIAGKGTDRRSRGNSSSKLPPCGTLRDDDPPIGGGWPSGGWGVEGDTQPGWSQGSRSSMGASHGVRCRRPGRRRISERPSAPCGAAGSRRRARRDASAGNENLGQATGRRGVSRRAGPCQVPRRSRRPGGGPLRDDDLPREGGLGRVRSRG